MAAAPSGSYAPRTEVPDPRSILGYAIGTRHMRPDEVVRCFETIGASSDRVVTTRHGWSYQGRPLLHAVVTSPRNHARLDAIQEANRQLTIDPDSVSDADMEQMPVVVYAGYGVHGNESSAAETGVLLLYHLAAEQGEATQKLLDNLVVVIDPNINPDGHDRFADSVNNFRSGTPTLDSQDMEHNEPWPGGRTNHYWFDINRDWLPISQRESRARVDLWQRWRPQLSLDYHEMGSDQSYFFQPGIPERTNPNTPQSNQDLTARIAGYHAAALDAVGQPYFTEERYDDYYYGKGSTYPDIQGAVGILFEQGSARALKRQTAWGVLRYDTTLRNQTITSLSSLRAALDMRMDLLGHQRQFYLDAKKVPEQLGHDGWLIGGDKEGDRTRELIALLQRHGIRVHELKDLASITLKAQGREMQRFLAGLSFVVPTNQPQARLAKALLERTTEFPAKIFYDVSTWCLPLAYGLRVATVGKLVGGDIVGDPMGPMWVSEDPAEVPPNEEGVIISRLEATPKAGYLIPWSPQGTPGLLAKLHGQGVRVRMAKRPFTADVRGNEARAFGMGTLFVPTGADPEVASAVVNASLGVPCYAADTTRTPDGPDLGGSDFPLLPAPRVALIGGPGTSGYRVGEIFHLFGERVGLPVSLITGRDLSRLDLTRYGTVIVPSGAYRAFDEEDVAALTGWHKAGGTLVALGTSTSWAVRAGLADAKTKAPSTSKPLPSTANMPYGELRDARALQRIAGAYFQVRLDTTHPLAAGLPKELAVFRTHTTSLAWRGQGQTVASYTQDPLLSGYASDPRVVQLSRGAAVLAQRTGGGRTVLILDDVVFRGFQRAAERLLLNAVFFGSTY